MQQIKGRPGEYAYVIGPYMEPVATVRPGELFEVETADAFENRVDSPDADIAKIIELPYVNPLTGPVYVEGAEKGDTLAVTIHSIEVTRDYGVSALIPEFGGLCSTVFTRTLNEPLPPRVMLHPIRDGEITFSEELPIATIPVQPFYGTIGTAPELEAISSLSPGAHGGNMDAADVKPGNTIFLPVHVPGALLYVGDGHAAQGDAEVCGVAVEVPTRGTLSVELIKGAAVRTPRVDSPEHIMTIGSARPMEDAARIAFYELVRWLEDDHGIARLIAYQLCSQVAEVRVANMVDTLYSIVAKFPKRYLPNWEGVDLAMDVPSTG
jgi:amidase